VPAPERQFRAFSRHGIPWTAKSASAGGATSHAVLNAGRGNPNWIATTPRAAFFLLARRHVRRSTCRSNNSISRGDRWLVPDDASTFEPDDEIVVAAPLAAQARVPVHTVDVVIGRSELTGRTLPGAGTAFRSRALSECAVPCGSGTALGRETTLEVGDVIRVTSGR
jgi:hypothetical protein